MPNRSPAGQPNRNQQESHKTLSREFQWGTVGELMHHPTVNHKSGGRDPHENDVARTGNLSEQVPHT